MPRLKTSFMMSVSSYSLHSSDDEQDDSISDLEFYIDTGIWTNKNKTGDIILRQQKLKSSVFPIKINFSEDAALTIKNNIWLINDVEKNLNKLLDFAVPSQFGEADKHVFDITIRNAKEL